MNGCCRDRICTPDDCMQIPDGSTCGDCLHVDRCLALGYTSRRDSTSCDFWPRRFVSLLDAVIARHKARKAAP